MPEWKVKHAEGLGMKTLPKPSDDQVAEYILENNQRFSAFRDPIEGCAIVECENRPRDLPIWGISFVPVEAKG